MNGTGKLQALRNAAGRLAGDHRSWIVLAMLAGAAFCLRPLVCVDSQQQRLWQAADALVQGQYEEAESLAQSVLERQPECATAMLIAGESAAWLDRRGEALSLFLRVAASCPAEYVRAQYQAATLFLARGRAAAAEECLRRVLAIDAQHLPANEKLAVLLQIEGRTWEALPYVRTLIRSGQCGRDELVMAGGIDAMMVDDPPFVENCLRTVPDDPLVLLGGARVDLIENRVPRAEAVFRRILERNPQQIEAQARLGEILLDRPQPAEFLRWRAALPQAADAHPRIWFVRGLWAKRNGQMRAAVRCFLEALRLHPNHTSSNFQLSQVLLGLGLSEAAEPFIERARMLSKLEFTLHELRGLTDLSLIERAAEMNEQLGRPWEAAGWCHVALFLDPQAAWAKAKLASPDYFALQQAEFTLASAQPALDIDRFAYALPVWPKAEAGSAGAAVQTPVDGKVRLVDVAAEAGLAFRYYNGTTSTSGPDHIIQTTGGGVGVIDYDADGWPDLYFAQSGLWEQRGERNPHRDRLFRNLGNGRFVDVSEQAGLGDGEFSQGAAVGDYNDDGFPDIFVANIGRNRLYQNNGDGTFRDVTEEAGVGGSDKWTTSCAIVDLSGDGFPEIYAVDYLSLKEVMTRACIRQGHPMGCAPTLFAAEQDRLYFNLGDGRFRDVTDESGIRIADGKGLGIVAADFDGSGRINVFVGNDTTPNFYFVNQLAGPGKPPRFVEKGLEMGVAVNEAGQSQASMGIAAGDANGDGLLDLFVTTFYRDSDTLFLQSPEHTFSDETRRARLRDPTFNMLGFGAQFLDGDLDGWPDLIVSNGHVDRSFDSGVPDLMPPQYFQNLGNGTFAELSGGSLGAYFQKQYLGRSMAVLDWNRDGKEDVCISHLDAPAALLTNRTPTANHYLAVKLCGVTSNRDAIGSILELTAGGRTWTRQVIGGNGYMASNEHQVIFGLGPAKRIDRLQVRWPSGAKQTFDNLPADQELVVVEGVGCLYCCR